MSKPLELVVFERSTCTELGIECRMDRDCTFWVNPRTGERFEEFTGPDLPGGKRLEDAELAAEWWRFPMADFGYPDDPDEWDGEDWDGYTKQYRERFDALERFARLPHFDEEA